MSLTLCLRLKTMKVLIRLLATTLSTTMLLIAHSTHADDVISVPTKRSDIDVSHAYHVELLTLALDKASYPFSSIDASVPMTESRAAIALEKHQLIDVFWMGTDSDKEAKLRAIPIPTTKGLIGMRKLLIQRDRYTEFEQVESVEQLQRKLACQGHDWPDTRILRNAGIRVATSTQYETLFGMLSAGRCDFFPRSLHDFEREPIERSKKYPELIGFQPLILRYPFAVFFFTNTQDEALAKAIETGLTMLNESGEFDTFMRQHPLTRRAFPLSQYSEDRIIDLGNTESPKGYNTEKYRQFWISLKPTQH